MVRVILRRDQFGGRMIVSGHAEARRRRIPFLRAADTVDLVCGAVSALTQGYAVMAEELFRGRTTWHGGTNGAAELTIEDGSPQADAYWRGVKRAFEAVAAAYPDHIEIFEETENGG